MQTSTSTDSGMERSDDKLLPSYKKTFGVLAKDEV